MDPSNLLFILPAFIDVCREPVLRDYNCFTSYCTALYFTSLFEKNPEVKSDFIPFKSIEVEDEQYNRTLRNHGLRVLSTVAKMIHRVNEEEKMIAVVRATGSRHGKYNTNASLIDVGVKLAFILQRQFQLVLQIS